MIEKSNLFTVPAFKGVERGMEACSREVSNLTSDTFISDVFP